MQNLTRPTSASTRQTSTPNPKPPYQVNTQTKVFDTAQGRLLCIADIRGRLSALNDLAREANASAIIHTGDFGFFGAWLCGRDGSQRSCCSRGLKSRQDQ